MIECQCGACGHEFIAEPVGGHRLICGDAGDGPTHEQVIGGETINLVLSDPPYGVGVKYSEFFDGEEETRELISRFMPLVLKWGRALITSGQRLMWDYPRPTWFLAWIHPAANAGGPWGFNCVNPILAYGADPYLGNRLGRRADYLMLAAGRKGEGDGHPVAKPLDVWKWVMERGSVHAGDNVLDPFMGSGTTILVAEQLGRRAFGIEIAPAYCDISVMRWQKMTGRIAVKSTYVAEVQMS